MIKLKYNILIFIQILLNIINSFLIIKIFGVSSQTDSFFVLQTIFNTISLIQCMPVEQFMFFYNDAKVESREFAEDFLNFSILLSLFLGIISFFIFSIFSDYVIKLFAFNLDYDRFIILKRYVEIYKWILIFIPLNCVLISLLTAEMYIGYPYILSAIPIFFSIFSQFLCLKYNWKDMNIIVKFLLFGNLLSYFLSLIFIKIKTKYDFKLVVYHSLSKNYIKNSLSMKLGHNIHNFLFPMVTNNFISTFPVGVVSCFYYAQRIVSIIQSIITGPSSRILQSKIAFLYSSNNLNLIKKDIKQYFKFFSFIAIISLLITYFIIPYAFKLVLRDSISDKNIFMIREMFLLLAFWNLILFWESPFDMIIITSKKSKIFIFVNSLFIMIYFTILFGLKKFFGVYSIFPAMIIAQSINFIFYSRYSLKILNLNQKYVIKKIIKYIKEKIVCFYPGI